MIVELLTFDGCPNAEIALDRVHQAMRLERTSAAIDLVCVDTPEAAQRAKFLGSPTVRVNGEDVEVAARGSRAFGLMCRTYECDGVISGTPSVEMIRESIRRHAT